MSDNRSSCEVWCEFVAAVAYVAEIERPGLAVWNALAEALQDWAPDGARSHSCSTPDPLRGVLGYVCEAVPELGAPGGVSVGLILEAAMTSWSEAAASRLNDGYSFRR